MAEGVQPRSLIYMKDVGMKARVSLSILAAVLCASAASAQNTIYGYAIGNWRNGPVVQISPLFETTEMFTTPQLIKWVRGQWPEQFTDTTDIDVQRFATIDEGALSRTTLEGKYGVRKLPVNMMEAEPMPKTPPRPEGIRATGPGR